MSFKQVILVRSDLKMPKGKLAVQVAHASVEAVLGSSSDKVNSWRREGMMKVVLKVVDEVDLRYYLKKARAQKIKTAIITDAGKTFFDTSTTTCCAIGPDIVEKIDTVTGGLKMI
ncbi:peptidyl-tRNA hydrolase [Candidatus Woesearchaeota archaeon]|jgi:peptidyl-tRNA hydrolase, PTH2 family|nr:peptidyl-tRNA hydrolase [Candidatus Woesearchaeota archaeon]MBT6044751.1 peptidyl-tRNA hydrolase [Candidatus Woesearchaeota archaeon]